MDKKESKPLVHLILHPLKIEKDAPFYFFGKKGYSCPDIKACMLDVNAIPEKVLKEINLCIVNLDSFFEDDFFILTNSLSANRYLSPLYDSFLKGYKILEILSTEPEIYVCLDNASDIKLWKKFLESNAVAVTSPFAMSLKSTFKSFVGQIFGIFKEYVWTRSSKKEKVSFSKEIFIHWITQRNMSFKECIEGSSYFGAFIRDMHKRRDISLLGHIPSGNADFKNILKTDFPFIKEYIRISDILWAFFKSLKVLFPFKSKVFLKGNDYTEIVNTFLKKDFWDGCYMQHLLFFRAFKRILGLLKEDTKIIYPFENQPWEKALLMANTKIHKNVKFYAYQFFPIAENFLIHQFSEKQKKKGNVPTCILTSDSCSNRLLEDQKIKTIKLGSMRYNKDLKTDLKKVDKKNKVLCSLFLDEVEALSLAKKIIYLAQHIDCEFIINYHALLPKHIIAHIETMIENSTNIRSSEQKVSDLLEDVFLLIYNSTSAYLEGALSGVAVLFLPCEGIINMDRFYSLGKVVHDSEDAVVFIHQLMRDDLFYQKYASETYLNAHKIIYPYNDQSVEIIIK